MIFKRIYLDSEHPEVYIDTYIADLCPKPRDAILVIPGGGYRNVCSDREGEPIALAYLAKGLNAFVLHYRVDRTPYPAQLIDASRAILHIKEHAEEYSVNKDRIFTVGFSAGGHLAGSLAILHNDKEVLDTLGICEGENKPRGAVLAYPVVSAILPTHEGSFINLSGGIAFADIPDSFKERVSLERRVTKSSSPAFIWHTAEDAAVPPCGSLALANSYINAGVEVMLHLYPHGCHGVALANELTSTIGSASIQPLAEGWVDASVDWFDNLEN